MELNINLELINILEDEFFIFRFRKWEVYLDKSIRYVVKDNKKPVIVKLWLRNKNKQRDRTNK